MNYNSDIPIATDGNQLPRCLLSIKMAVFMDRVCKMMCAHFVGRFNFRYWFCGHGTQQAEQPLGWAAQLAENRWLAHSPAVVPVWYLSVTCLVSLYTIYLSASLSTSFSRFLMDPSGSYFDVSTWITINKTADFLIVTPQKACFSHILAENRLFDQ